ADEVVGVRDDRGRGGRRGDRDLREEQRRRCAARTGEVSVTRSSTSTSTSTSLALVVLVLVLVLVLDLRRASATSLVPLPTTGRIEMSYEPGLEGTAV